VVAGPIRYVESDGLQIAYQVVGSGPVDVVYVPGSANHIESMWDIPEIAGFTQRLASYSRLILIDKRGTGLSDRLPNDNRSTVEERMRDVTAVLDATDSSSAILFGTADGTPVALLAGATYPDRIRGLALWASSARLLWDEDYPIGIPDDAVEPVLEAFRASWGNDDDPGLDVVAPSVAADPRWRAGMARIERRSCTPAEAVRYWAVNLHVDVRSALPAITVPTLVMHCTGDQLYPVTHGRFVADHVQGAEFLEVPGTDHFFFAENGERVADELEEFVTGSRSGATPHRRLATVLFTDIVGSTQRSAELGDRRWHALLEAHDAVLAVQVERHRGRVVKTTGDGCLAVFDGPRQAILAAEAIRDAIDAIGLELRAGVHTGEVEFRDADLAGLAVHIGARVAAIAASGEVLVSSTVKDLVVGSGMRFVARGSHTLKGVPGEWHLYAASV
jgi:pimeloyl-ACP methyl ester carboxylesterase